MANSNGLTASPLDPQGSFNWQYLLAFIVDGVLTLFFLFYFNRLFASVVAYAIRLYTWHRLRIYIDIEALQISLLGGRIFFKGLQYHGENETILVHGGYITWRYWLTRVKKCKIFQDDSNAHKRQDTGGSSSSDYDEPHSDKHRADPCRISVKVSGVEAFLYNRSPAYDIIVNSVSQHDPVNSAAQAQGVSTKDAERTSAPPAFHCALAKTKTSASEKDKTSRDSSTSNDSDDRWHEDASSRANSHRPHVPSFLHLLPIHVECSKAAAVLGNEHTPSIITTRIDSASGTFDASKSGPLDIFKILIDFNVTKPLLQMKPNVDFKRPQLAEAATLRGNYNTKVVGHSPGTAKETKDRTSTTFKRSSQAKQHKHWWAQYLTLSARARQSVDSVARYVRTGTHSPGNSEEIPAIRGQSRWLGLSRYLEDSKDDEHDEWGAIEYAKTSTLADITSLDFKFYWDIPGTVPSSKIAEKTSSAAKLHDINGSTPPEYGMDLHIQGGHINYGPWADRHRINLQQMYFPFPFVDAAPASPLKSGDGRVCTVFKLLLTIEEETILRVPFREPSKDWRWKGRGAALSSTSKAKHDGKEAKSRRKAGRHRRREKSIPNTDLRPFAWFDIKVGSQSTIKYTMDMVPGPSGYKNDLSMDVSGISIFTSLNHALLWRCGRTAMNCDLSNPLAWSGLRDWVFDIEINELDFFLLRDHTFLLVDMIEDWTTGPLPDFMTFIPYRYRLKINFVNFKLFLNVNDANIVNNSDDTHDNDFVILYGARLPAELMIPLDRFRPVQNEITFNVEAFNLGFELRLPVRNTLNTFVSDKNVAQLKSVTLQGTYNYYSEVRPGITETLNMTIHGKSLIVHFYGFFARQLAKIKENYFGDDVHFRTLEEYQELARRNFEGYSHGQMSTKSNDLDVILDIIADDINILLPASLYESKEYIKAHVENTNVDLRVNNYYLELMVNSSPLEMSCRSSYFAEGTFKYVDSETQIFLDIVKCFGHRLFGLPPTEPAYVSNWDIEAGNIVGECSTVFVKILLEAVQSLALTITDSENALPLPQLVVAHDSTFVRFSCPLIGVQLHVDGVAFALNIQNVNGAFNDLVRDRFARVLHMTVAHISLACLEVEATHRELTHHFETATTLAYLDTAMAFDMLERSKDFEQTKSLQRQFLNMHDRRHPRSVFMYEKYISVGALSPQKAMSSIPLPSLPVPLKVLGRKLRKNGPKTTQASHDFDPLRRAAAEGLRENMKATMAFSSPFRSPHFPLLRLRPDLRNVPDFPDTPNRNRDEVKDVEVDDFGNRLNQNCTHTSLMVQLETGLASYVQPAAIYTAANIMDKLQPRTPATLLDRYQISTIQDVMANKAKAEGKNRILDVNVRVPCIRLRLHNEIDEYSVSSDSITVGLRMKTEPERKHQESSASAHITSDSLTFSAQRSSINGEDSPVALQAAVDDILLWLMTSDRTSIHVSFHLVDIGLASREFEYLASVIHRTTMLVDDLRTRFLQIMALQSHRMRFLVFRLTKLSEETSDPPFLTRISYVLRTAKDHLRNSASWKMLSKLRHVYRHLEAQTRQPLTEECMNGSCHTPDTSQAYVLASIEQWQNWDAIYAGDCEAMQYLYGPGIGTHTSAQKPGARLGLGIQGAGLKLLIDPGKHQSGVTIERILLSLAITPPPPPSAMNLFQEYNESKSTIVQIKTMSIVVQIAWNICQLVDRILTLFEENMPGQKLIEGASNPILKQEARSKETFQVVFASKYAGLNLRMINIVQLAMIDEVKCSVCGSGWADALPDFSVNALTSAKTASLEMRRRDQVLWRSRVNLPSMWVASETVSKSKALDSSLKIAGDCEELNFAVEEEILGLLNVANDLITNEVAYIVDLSEKHKKLRQKPSSSPTTYTTRNFHINVALFLNIYHVKIALFEDLQYRTEGRVIRLAIIPHTRAAVTYQINFDLKAQMHTLESTSAREHKTAPRWTLPAINGRLSAQYQEKTFSISASLIMEKIAVSGSTIYQVLSIVASPQLYERFDAVKHDASVITQAATSIGTRARSEAATNTTPSESPLNFIFDTHVVLDGVKIVAKAPSVRILEGETVVLFALGNTQMRMSNRTASGNLPLRFPNITLALGQLALKVETHKGERTQLHGSAGFEARFTCAVNAANSTLTKREFQLSANGPDIKLYPTTGPALVRILAHFQRKFTGLDFSREKRYLKRLRQPPLSKQPDNAGGNEQTTDATLRHGFSSSMMLDLQGTEVAYFVKDPSDNTVVQSTEHLAFTLANVKLLARGEREARLSIEETKLALRPSLDHKDQIQPNFALLPELLFDVTHARLDHGNHFAFSAAGKALEIVLNPFFMAPITRLERSLDVSNAEMRSSSNKVQVDMPAPNLPGRSVFGSINVASLTGHANFAGALIRLQGNDAATPGPRSDEHSSSAVMAEMRAPGIAIKVQFVDRQLESSTLSAEVRIEASSNTLRPSVVPLILQIADSVQDLVKDAEERKSHRSPNAGVPQPTTSSSSNLDQNDIVQTDPRVILGKMRLNIGFQICRQEMALTCQPIAKITAFMKLEDTYVTINNVDSIENGNFFAASIAFRGLKASLQHVYSRDPTLSFEMASVILSIMNNKHFSGKNGISAMLKINPTEVQINAKQLQDILLFREIWYPLELRGSRGAASVASKSSDSHEYFVRRYQQIAEATTFPWNASIVIADLKVNLDLGQAIGKLSFGITNMWVSSRKTSSSQQSLCVGVDEMSVDSTGRMSGYLHLDKVKVRTSIAWLAATNNASQTPLIQGSLGFDRIQVKLAFDYQTFAVADITMFEFIMYNVRDHESQRNDRLVAILDGEKVNIYCTALTAALGYSLVKTFERLIDEKKESFQQSLMDVESFLERRRRTTRTAGLETLNELTSPKAQESTKMPISLHTDVVITLGSLDVGAFPRTLLDTQILRLEASNTQVRFAVALENGTIHSGLGLTLGQVSAALATIPQSTVPKSLGEVSIDHVVKNVHSARGGIILRVPRVVAAMQTWQPHDSRTIEYIFRSSFEGKIDVGWNYSRISYIRGMYATHARTLAARLGKPLPESAVKISAPALEAEAQLRDSKAASQLGNRETASANVDHKITAVVNLPQSKYDYRALEPPIIETPQLRDMGEATPPLEWIGLQRERLPNLTHQIIIVTLLEVAKEVEDAYSRVLGSA